MRAALRLTFPPLVRRFSAATLHLGDAASFSRLARARRSAAFLDPSQPVPRSVVDELVALTARAPSGFNMQPYRVVLVTDGRARERVAASMLGAANAARVRDAPLVAVFAADLRCTECAGEVQEMEAAAGGKSPAYLRELPFTVAAFAGGGGGGGADCGTLRGAAAGALSALTGMPLPPFGVPGVAWAYKQTALAAMTYVYAATSQGLATRMMEGLDPAKAAAAVGLPAPRFSVPLLVVAGYELAQQPEPLPPPSPRRVKGVFFKDSVATDY
jgi:nitroreductase